MVFERKKRQLISHQIFICFFFKISLLTLHIFLLNNVPLSQSNLVILNFLNLMYVECYDSTRNNEYMI